MSSGPIDIRLRIGSARRHVKVGGFPLTSEAGTRDVRRMGACRWLVVAATLLTTASAWGAHAIDPGLRCLGAGISAAARATHALLGCEAGAARNSVALAPA